MCSDHRSEVPLLGRRAVVVGAGALGCGALAAGCASGTTAPTTGPLGPAADVPVGGATIYADQSVVVTQATAGDYAGFSAICPHQGCAVGAVEGAEIVCPCHGSRFDLAGAVLTGPAETGLSPVAVSVQGDQIILG